MEAHHLVTAEELERMGQEDGRFELLDGVLVPMMTPASARHGQITQRIAAQVTLYADAHNAGVVYAAETGFILRRNPDVVRAPDVSFVSRARATLQPRRGYFPGAPDFAVEVRSPDESLGDLFEKAAQFLAAGTELVWVVEPDDERVHVFTTDEAPASFGRGDTLDGGNVLAEFTLQVEEIFRMVA